MGNSHKNLLFRNHWDLLSKWFQTRRFLWEFPIGSYVKLSSAVVALLVRGMKCRTHFWKGTTQGKKNSSPLKLLSQSQPNFSEMILGWFPSKNVSGISYL
jgi:hypothetical protein